ncbi:MAG TPA: hypothetical protein VK324_14080 [Tepidisphaeraceae bacterium]|nr:hypothetical protein [Tepidisphaeraceae bacterium]
MTQFNPLIPAILQSQIGPRARAVSKNQQIRKTQILARNVAATEDTFEHTVESADKIDPAHDQEPQQDPRQRRKKRPTDRPDDAPPQVDLTA